jgi:hypothetical protein
MWLRCIVICVLSNFGWSRSPYESDKPEVVIDMYAQHSLRSIREDRELMELCEASDGHVYPQTSGHAWRCMPGAANAYDAHDCTAFLEPLLHFVVCSDSRLKNLGSRATYQGAGECTDTLHAYDPLPGVGLGQVAASHAAVMETFAREGVRVSIHDCAGEKRDRLRASCTNRVSPSLLELYTPASEYVCGIAPPPGLAFVDGQHNWTGVKADPGVLLLDPHATFFNIGDMHHCEVVRKWLHEPSILGAKLFHDIVAVPVAFHVRLFDGNDAYITVSENMTVTPNNNTGDLRVGGITNHMVQGIFSHIIQFATAEWREKQTLTYVATDSPMIRRKLAKFPFIKTNPHAEATIPPEHRLYDTASLYDFHALSMAKTIISMPSSSTFSRYAACRTGANILTAHSLKEIGSVINAAYRLGKKVI